MRYLLIAFSIILATSNAFSAGRKKDSSFPKGILYFESGSFNLETHEKTSLDPDAAGGGGGNYRYAPMGPGIRYVYEFIRPSKKKTHELHVVTEKGEFIAFEDTRGLFSYGWSPDSRYIAFHAETDVQVIRIVDVLTRETWTSAVPSIKALNLGGINWSLNGERLFFSARFKVDEDALDQQAIFSMDLNGQNLQKLITFDQPTGSAISPDQKRIAYSPMLKSEIFVSDIDGANVRQVSKTKEFENFLFWSPDGKWVGAKQETNYSSIKSKFMAFEVATGRQVKLPVPHYSIDVQWWGPQEGKQVDCQKIVQETLGEGQPLESLAAPDSQTSQKPAKTEQD